MSCRAAPARSAAPPPDRQRPAPTTAPARRTSCAAAQDADWAAARIAALQGKKLTAGLYYDDDGTEHPFESSSGDDAYQKATKAQEDTGAQTDPTGRYIQASHVKVAAAMLNASADYGVLVINNPADRASARRA
ncbi:DddA-like double-stranded DNA deaminase toxin [Amycolatopsis sp. NPDC004079]|uniref:DddA-like double-stranded DNA deaminase toxin n=1 Tax=Amycolatopsis sp. NPDC004079 TaxID=3154549 RepID=UPI0033BE439D